MRAVLELSRLRKQFKLEDSMECIGGPGISNKESC